MKRVTAFSLAFVISVVLSRAADFLPDPNSAEVIAAVVATAVPPFVAALTVWVALPPGRTVPALGSLLGSVLEKAVLIGSRDSEDVGRTVALLEGATVGLVAGGLGVGLFLLAATLVRRQRRQPKA
jgi:hypothetical protein